jgi:predicted short-subunit dehydrogenase-like oxidoreductase (DUF2520 family)
VNSPDRDPADRGTAADRAAFAGTVAVVGGGRLGTVLHRALDEAGIDATGPHGRGFDGTVHGIPVDIVLLCVPDGVIASAARAVLPGPLVGHCSGATKLTAIGEHRGFSIHPMMTFVPGVGTDVFSGVAAAVAATDPAALATARQLAETIGLRPFDVAESDRVAYHAAGAIAANFLVTLEEAAGRLIATAKVDRGVLVPIARAALENWARTGPAALTGPIARGDTAVVTAHRAAVAERTPELLPLFDVLADATRDLLVSPVPQPTTGRVAS